MLPLLSNSPLSQRGKKIYKESKVSSLQQQAVYTRDLSTNTGMQGRLSQYSGDELDLKDGQIKE